LSNHPTATPLERPSFRFSRRQAIALVFVCTIFGAAAQILFKFGANDLAGMALGNLFGHPVQILRILLDPPIFAGYCLYGLSTILLTLALRDGELSILYPVISLTYVWVTVLSVLIFKESMNLFKLAGIMVIVIGVAVLGRNPRR